MKILDGKKWRDDFLDQAMGKGKVRIRVVIWKNLDKIENLFFIRKKNYRIILNYLKEIGFKNVFIKILSRSSERLRNDKYISCGFGHIIETCGEDQLLLNKSVVFIAPSHSRCMERVVLPADFVRPVSDTEKFSTYREKLLYIPAKEHVTLIDGERLYSICGWSEYSGIELSHEVCKEILDEAEQNLNQTEIENTATFLDISTPTQCEEFKVSLPLTKKNSNKKKACLFGYGNYAKTAILPNIRDYIDIVCIHEIDPTQIAGIKNNSIDTSPSMREDEEYDVYFIAAYHHIHAPLTVDALNQNAYAVVEKPLATTREQLDELLSARKHSSGAIFSCFNRRYSIFNNFAREDISVKPGDPISYHCIVYEVPLPELHWYRWDNSRSRLISNGCHWIDHFLFLNDFCPVAWSDVVEARNGTINVSAQLENGAFFSMVLSDIGSERVGVREYVELRANNTTVRIIDGQDYISEKSCRILRRKKVNKLSMYSDMYRQIAAQIDRGHDGDSYQSIEVSSSLVLDLEDKLIEYRKREN
jgi:predicted dehydrogenase